MSPPVQHDGKSAKKLNRRELSCVPFRLSGSAKRHHLDVWMYLRDVLDRMLSGETDYSRLVPDVWKADHPEAVREYRVAESRQKEDRKQITRARRIVAAKLKREQNASQ